MPAAKWGGDTDDTNKELELGGVMLQQQQQPPAPDGGARAWLVMLGSFFCNGILFGVINSYSVLYAKFYDNFLDKGVANPSSSAALVGSLAMGAMFLVSAISGVLTDTIGLRTTTFLGGLIASGGMFLSSFCIDSVPLLCLTFGVMYGLGGALSYTPSLAILGHYFQRYLGVVNGVVTSGSSLFTIVMPYVIDSFLNNLGIDWTLKLLALMAAVIMALALLFKPHKTVTRASGKKGKLFNTDVLKNRKYLVWAGVIAGSLFGYFVPYVYIKKFVEESDFPQGTDGKLPVICIGITSGLGRLIFGYIGDRSWVNRILLQQLAFLMIGLLTMVLPFCKSFILVLVISLGMGLFDGCFISLLGPIAFDICGREGATQAIGFLLGLCSIPLTVGPYVAGRIYEAQGNYVVPFVLAGVPPIVGSVLLFLTRCVKSGRRGGDEVKHDGMEERPLKPDSLSNGRVFYNNNPNSTEPILADGLHERDETGAF